MGLLENIHGHQDLVGLNEQQRQQLCREIREFLVSSISKTGGHLASNLGVVELTVALETVFNTEEDRLVFDVGHQSYVHKLLTGRQADFEHLRQFGGMSGFPKPAESQADAFVAGHASSSVSIALGMARARTALGKDYQVAAVLGDGAATGGMAYEGLNDASVSGEPMVIVLNDNAMSIDRNVGGMAFHLRKLRTKQRYLGMKARYRTVLEHIPGGKAVYRFTRAIKDWIRRALIPPTIFESMGFTYLGPADGHDTEQLIELLESAKKLKAPVVVHVLTHKGKGYKYAEENPRKFHGIGAFDPESGKTASSSGKTFSDTFGETMVKLAGEHPELCAVTAAMPGGTGLLKMMEACPERVYDVGIAEEHAVSMAGGLSKQGMIPVVAIYSTFLQRSYDMILQDLCMLKLHTVLAVDRAGLVGEDGQTHHGIFDVGFLRQAPGMTVLCPASCKELEQMLTWSVEKHNGPVAIRYPRGGDRGFEDSGWDEAKRVYCHKSGTDAAIVTYGPIVNNALEAAKLLDKQGCSTAVIRLTGVAPLPAEELLWELKGVRCVVVLEETAPGCGIHEAIAWELRKKDPEIRVHSLDIRDGYAAHGSVKELYHFYGLDGESIKNFVTEVHSS